MQRAIEHCVWLIWDYGLSEDQKPWRVNQNIFFFFFRKRAWERPSERAMVTSDGLAKVKAWEETLEPGG